MRTLSCGLCVWAVVGLAPGAALAVTAAPAAITITQSHTLDTGVLASLNAIRVAHGLVPLTLAPALEASARAHSSDMLAHGYFAHPSFDGTAFWQRIEGYYPSSGDSYWSVGENLLWSTGGISAAQSLALWMASPPHRANILDPAWRQIGIAAESSPDATGVYGGAAVTVITTDFGVRRALGAPLSPR